MKIHVSVHLEECGHTVHDMIDESEVDAHLKQQKFFCQRCARWGGSHVERTATVRTLAAV